MLMLRRALFAVSFLVVGLSVLPAMAQFTVCNQSPKLAYVAMGHWDNTDYVTQGWWIIEPGQCAVPYDGELQYQYYYLYGETDADKSGNVEYWGGDVMLCTNYNDFIIWGSVDCDTGFTEIDTGKERSYQFNLQ